MREIDAFATGETLDLGLQGRGAELPCDPVSAAQCRARAAR